MATESPALDVQSMVSGATYPTVVDIDQGSSRAQLTKTRTLEASPGEDNLALFPWRILGLLVVALTLSLPIKDFKDIEGDKKDGVLTIPVIFGESVARTIVASGIFISFMLSVFILNDTKLFWAALFFGGLAFLVMTNKKIKPRQLIWWVLGVLILYTAVLLKILFF